MFGQGFDPEGADERGRSVASGETSPVDASVFPPDMFAERERTLRRLSAEMGHHFSLSSDSERPAAWRLSILPRVLSPAEWAHIRSGVLQRMRAFGLFIRDVYGARRIVTEGVLPMDLLLAFPGYYRQMIGMSGRFGSGILLGAVDLCSDGHGGWMVFENHFSFPSGLSHVIQNRRMLAQAFPEVFTDRQVAPVAGFGSDLVEALRGDDGSGDPRIVLLTRGDSLRSDFDDSFLARQMGVVSVRPADLIVRDAKVFLKTIAGLERVGVILRKVETNAVDPITFPENADRGVPGLAHCVREGTVRMQNPLGSEVADDRSLLPFSDAIIRFYTGEAPLLPTVETYHCYDRDQAEWVNDRREEFLFDAVATPRVMVSLDCRQGGDSQFGGNPEWTVARRRPPGFRAEGQSGSAEDRGYFLRVFGVLGRRPVVLPGGLSWAPGDTGTLDFISGMKDTWVIDKTLGRTGRIERSTALESDLAPAFMPAPSRVAEGIYWLARYLERARNAAHQAGLLETIRRADLAPADADYCWPLWKGVAAAAHFEPFLEHDEMPESFSSLFGEFVGSSSRPSSVSSCIHAAERNLNLIREWISPEMTEVFFQWREGFDDVLSRQGADGVGAFEACRLVSREHARFSGVLERTLAHDAVYRFWLIGSAVEWAIGCSLLLESILPSRVSLQERHIEDDTDLTALLRVIGCLDAYRREYRSRAYLDRVFRLIWRKEDLPVSFLFNLFRIHDSLGAVDAGGRRRTAGLRRVERMIERVRAFPVEDVFPARTAHLDFGTKSMTIHARTVRRVAGELAWLRKGLEGLHLELEDRFFSHQEGGEGVARVLRG